MNRGGEGFEGFARVLEPPDAGCGGCGEAPDRSVGGDPSGTHLPRYGHYEVALMPGDNTEREALGELVQCLGKLHQAHFTGECTGKVGFAAQAPQLAHGYH